MSRRPGFCFLFDLAQGRQVQNDNTAVGSLFTTNAELKTEPLDLVDRGVRLDVHFQLTGCALPTIKSGGLD